ncbi:hypothetical protein RHMOL_Rhmol13G0194700 [Rhododendron molle]|uniref:Uncharacterized protein n=1 Tax=Rhododendron molle TaxID=49168 RepID=A0ACC0L8G3_RHOML|nr:hypothetical protein RHMOL_Rhmol13G0194700 [Rhododendron molle]
MVKWRGATVPRSSERGLSASLRQFLPPFPLSSPRFYISRAIGSRFPAKFLPLFPLYSRVVVIFHHPQHQQGMDARPDAYFTNLLQDGVILEDHSEREPQDEFGFTYANPNAQVLPKHLKPQLKRDPLLRERNVVASSPLKKTNCLWSTIQLSVNKFCGCFAGIEAKHQSGMNEEDKVSEAKQSYKDLHGGSFQFEHCWNILKYQPKWHVDVEKKKPKKNKTWTVPSSTTPELVDLGESDATFVDLERPIGTKAEKKKRKLAEIPSSPLVGILTDIKEEQKKTSDKKMDIIQQLHVEKQKRHQLDKERLREEQERNAIKKKKLRMKQFKEEERIMLLDTSALSHVQREYYQSRQMEILQEREKKFKTVLLIGISAITALVVLAVKFGTSGVTST